MAPPDPILVCAERERCCGCMEAPTALGSWAALPCRCVCFVLCAAGLQTCGCATSCSHPQGVSEAFKRDTSGDKLNLGGCG